MAENRENQPQQPEDILEENAQYFNKRKEQLEKLNKKLNEVDESTLKKATEILHSGRVDAMTMLRKEQESSGFEAKIASGEQADALNSLLILDPMPGADVDLFETDLSSSQQHTIKFQKARILSLQEELQKLSQMLVDKDKTIAEMRANSKAVTEEFNSTSRRLQHAEREADKAIKKQQAQDSKFQDMQTELIEVRKDAEKLQQRMKKTEAENRTKDARITRLTEDVDRLKAQIKAMKSEGREKMDAVHHEGEKSSQEIRRLERQRAELIAGFRKQQQLIDVLRKQKTHMEAAKMLSFTEDEFTRLIDLMGPKE